MDTKKNSTKRYKHKRKRYKPREGQARRIL